jgi:phosphatidylglycerophosphate synthase
VRRYVVAAGANLLVVGVCTRLAAHRLGGRIFTSPNLVTLSRAGAAAMLCGTAFSGRGRRTSLGALMLGCTVCDWLDGPIARRHGPTRLGTALDIETDSWLTLWAAIAGFQLGRLPGLSLLPPALRYPLMAGRTASMRPWQRAAGVAQMIVLAASLSCCRPTRRLALAAAGAQMIAVTASALSYSRSDGPAPDDVHESEPATLVAPRGDGRAGRTLADAGRPGASPQRDHPGSR